MQRKWLIVGGSLNGMMAVFHMFFWYLFTWSEELPKLGPENQGIMPMLNIVWIYTILGNTFISFYLAGIKEVTFLHKALMAIIGGGYLVRILFGYPYFGFNVVELVVWAYCLVTALCYGLSMRQK